MIEYAEQKRWAQAEVRGEDLTLLAQQWKQEELDGLACQRLSNSDLAAICDEHTIRIIKRHIKACTRAIRTWEDNVRQAKSFDDWWYFAILRVYAPKWHIEHRKVLKSILAAATVKQAGKEGQIEGISERDVENAKAVPIEGLYDWSKPVRISGRFRAYCPFHNENSGSFFIFRDNKYRCFGCGEHGDAIDFCMNTMNIDFIESVKYLIRK